MAQQSVTGSEEPGLTTVLASTLRVMWFRSANSQQLNAASQAGQTAAADYTPPPITACVYRGVHRWLADTSVKAASVMLAPSC